MSMTYKVSEPIKNTKWNETTERKQKNYESRRSIMLSTQNQTDSFIQSKHFD